MEPVRSLAALEAVIERGLATFVDVGSALLTIRDDGLYRETHGTFEEYCRERWGFSDRHARRLMSAAETVAQIGPIGPLPKTESQARELARIPDPAVRAHVWGRAAEAYGESVTAADVRRVADAMRPDPPLLAVVDLETGEVVDHPDIVDVSYDISDPGGKAELDRLRYLKRLTSSLHHVATLATLYDPNDVAAYADDSTLALIDAATRSGREWSERIRAAAAPLRVIAGGRS